MTAPNDQFYTEEETFEQFYESMREPDEDLGYTEEELFELCRQDWLRGHPGAVIACTRSLPSNRG